MEKRGQSIIEVLIAVGIGAIFLLGVASVVAPALQTGKRVQQIEAQTELAQEYANSIRGWAAEGWPQVLSNATGTNEEINILGGNLITAVPGIESVSLMTNGSPITYVRSFYLSDVYRDSSGNVTTTASGNYYDPSAKQVAVTVALASSSNNSTTYTFYIVRSAGNTFNQTSWAGGSGQNNPITFVSSSFATESNVAVNASGSITLASGGPSCIQ